METDAVSPGERLVLAREGLGLGQEEMAKNLRIRVTPLKQMERDAYPINEGMLDMMEKDIGISKRWIQSGEKPMYILAAHTDNGPPKNIVIFNPRAQG